MAKTGIFTERMNRHEEELRRIYEELYHDGEQYERLTELMKEAFTKRSAALKALDRKREQTPQWYRESRMLGITMYPKLFAGGLKGLMERLDYLSEQQITYLHLMPLLKMPHPMNDGGYAVEDFRTVDEEIGTNEELEELIREL